jgi:hypothetical protein
MVSALQGIAGSYRSSSKAASGPATGAAIPLTPDGKPPTPDLGVRAHILHNRNAKAAAVYLRTHMILDRGR